MAGSLFPVAINGVAFECDPDCGSDATIISVYHLRDLEFQNKQKIPLKPVTKLFKCPNSTDVVFEGYFHGTLRTKSGKTKQTKIHVLKMSPREKPLIGETDLLDLGLVRYNPSGACVKKITSYPKPKIDVEPPSMKLKFDALHEDMKVVFDGIGCLKHYEVELKLREDACGFYRRSNNVALHLLDLATERLREYITMKLFEWVPPHEPILYCSALMVIEEGKGKIRLVGDYRTLNKNLARVTEIPSPRVEDFMQKMANAKWFIRTDMRKGYWQLKLDEKSRNYCCLSTHLGNVRPTRLPMGVSCSGSIFDARVGSVLQHCQHTIQQRDDLLLGCATLEELFQEWKKVLKAFKQCGFTLSGEKTIGVQRRVKFYGMILDKDGIRPDPAKCLALRKAPRPIHQNGLISFLCTVSWNRRFIFRFAEEALPLQVLSQTKGFFDWQKEHQDAFEYLKNALCENTLNNHFVRGLVTELYTDAGKFQHTKKEPGALSAVLAQRDPKTGEPKPIFFASKVLTTVQRNYGQIELEALSVKFGVERFRYYLIGIPEVIIYVDAAPLVQMFNTILNTTPPRILNMVISIQDVPYTLIHRPGKANIADFISRNTQEETPEDAEIDLFKMEDDLENASLNMVKKHNFVCMNTIRQNTQEDPDMLFLIKCLKDGSWSQHKKDPRIKPYGNMFYDLSVIDGIVYRGSDIIIIPTQLREKVIHVLHELGHTGVNNILTLAKQYFYLPQMYKMVEAITSSCKV